MEIAETYFLKILGLERKDKKEIPDFMVKAELPTRLRLLFRSKLEQPLTFGEFTVITVSPEDFLIMSNSCLHIIEKWKQEYEHRKEQKT